MRKRPTSSVLAALPSVRPPPPGGGKRGEDGYLGYLLRQAQGAARLRLERFERMQTSKMAYAESGADLAFARNYVEYKIENYGSTPDDIRTLAQVIGYMERSEYQLYLKDAARI